ncbi:MAG TPA: hypothetical protein VGN42_19995 [Pirellulales bacterium]|jgi:hypothetical protein|nr:hypothetical protein [Pirellulales bacterium]
MTTTEQPDVGVQPRRRMGPGLIVLVAALAMLLLLAAAFMIGSLVSAWRVRTELAKIREADEPLTLADLDAFYASPPKERDATELWLSAFAVLDSPAYQNDVKELPVVGEGDAVPLPGKPWPQFDAAEVFLAKYREPLEKMHQASKRGGEARFPMNFSDGDAMLLAYVPRVRAAVRLLKLESEVHAGRNDPHAAAESVRAIFAAARSLERLPLLVSQLARITMNGAACSQIERLLPDVELSEEDLLQLDRDLSAIDEEAAFRRSLLGIRAIGIRDFENPSALAPYIPATSRWRLLRHVDEMAYLKLMERLIAASQSRQLPLRDATREAREEIAAFTGSPSARWRYPITCLSMPSLQATFDIMYRNKARQATTRSAIAIERYRRVHGAAPEDLDQLVPEFLNKAPEDPFDGAPLRYHGDATGYKVYSIGPDGIDQGGVSGAEGQPLDIVFEVRFKASAGGATEPAESE